VRRFTCFALWIAVGSACAAPLTLDEVSRRMEERLLAAGPWEARLRIDIELPGLRVRGKTLDLRVHPPGEAVFSTKGFALLPRRTLLLNPDSLFAGLSQPRLDWPRDSLGAASLRIRGSYREGGLLAFSELRVDTLRWLLTHLTTTLDTLPAIRLENDYLQVEAGHWLPLETRVDMRVSEELRGFYERLKQPLRRRALQEEGAGSVRLRFERHKRLPPGNPNPEPIEEP
jgi:hypothetical protein